MATIKLKNSSGVSGGAAKAPSALEVGEVAINNATNYESLFLKNSGNTIVKLPINHLKGVTSDVQTNLDKGVGKGCSYRDVMNVSIHDTAMEIIIKTKIPFTSSHQMPLIHLEGYAYGAQSPIELRIAFYIYDNRFVNTGCTSTCPWKPDIKLFTYTESDKKYVGLALIKEIYFPQFTINYIDVWGRNEGVQNRNYSKGWTYEYLPKSQTGTIIPATDLTSVPYKPIANDISGNATTATTASKCSGNSATATNLASIPTSFNGKYPLTFNVSGAIYSHAGLQFEGANNTLYVNKILSSSSGKSIELFSAPTYGQIQTRGSIPLLLNPEGNNVGIGTNNPTSRLHVIGDGMFSSTVTASSFKKQSSSDSYTLLGGGGHKLLTDFSMVGHSHNELEGTNYTSGGLEKPKDFGASKLRYQMLGQGTQANGSIKGGIPGEGYSDAIWLSAYGADVPNAHVLLFGKYNNKVGFRKQRYDAETWGEYCEFFHSGNSNKSSVDWTCKALNVNGNIDATDYNVNAFKFLGEFCDCTEISSSNLWSESISTNMFNVNEDANISGELTCNKGNFTDIDTNTLSVSKGATIGRDLIVNGECNAEFGVFTEASVRNAFTCNDIIYSRGADVTGDIRASGDITAFSTDVRNVATLEEIHDKPTDAIGILIKQNNEMKKQIEYLTNQIQELKNDFTRR